MESLPVSTSSKKNHFPSLSQLSTANSSSVRAGVWWSSIPLRLEFCLESSCVSLVQVITGTALWVCEYSSHYGVQKTAFYSSMPHPPTLTFYPLFHSVPSALVGAWVNIDGLCRTEHSVSVSQHFGHYESLHWQLSPEKRRPHAKAENSPCLWV